MEPKIKRWPAVRKAQIILDLLRGSKEIVDVYRENDLKQSEVEKWKEDFLKAGTLSLKAKKSKSLEPRLENLYWSSMPEKS